MISLIDESTIIQYEKYKVCQILKYCAKKLETFWKCALNCWESFLAFRSNTNMAQIIFGFEYGVQITNRINSNEFVRAYK